MVTISPDIPEVASMTDAELAVARTALGDRVAGLSAKRGLGGTSPDLDASIDAYSQLLWAVDDEISRRPAATLEPAGAI